MTEIKLPPLPSPGEVMSKWAYDEQDMQAYARAAIEADRQARGEPVAMTLGQKAVAAELLACFKAWEPMVCVLGNVRARDGADLMQAILNAALQPASVPQGKGK